MAANFAALGGQLLAKPTVFWQHAARTIIWIKKMKTPLKILRIYATCYPSARSNLIRRYLQGFWGKSSSSFLFMRKSQKSIFIDVFRIQYSNQCGSGSGIAILPSRKTGQITTQLEMKFFLFFQNSMLFLILWCVQLERNELISRGKTGKEPTSCNSLPPPPPTPPHHSPHLHISGY